MCHTANCFTSSSTARRAPEAESVSLRGTRKRAPPGSPRPLKHRPGSSMLRRVADEGPSYVREISAAWGHIRSRLCRDVVGLIVSRKVSQTPRPLTGVADKPLASCARTRGPCRTDRICSMEMYRRLGKAMAEEMC
jgi:hypothetical protein